MFRKLWSKLQGVIIRLILSKNAVSTYARLSAVTSLHILMYLHGNKPTPVAARFKAWVCWNCRFESRWRHGYLSFGRFVCVCVCVVSYRSWRRADYSSRGDLPNAACLSVTSKPQEWGSLDQPGLSNRKKMCLKLKFYSTYFIILQNTKESCVTDTTTKDIFNNLLSCIFHHFPLFGLQTLQLAGILLLSSDISAVERTPARRCQVAWDLVISQTRPVNRND